MASPTDRILLGGGVLDATPLIALMRADAEALHKHNAALEYGDTSSRRGIGLLSERTGIAERQLHEFFSGRRSTVTLAMADRYLCATGRHLRDLWPFLYTPEQAEADAAATDDVAAYRRALHAAAERRRKIANRERVAS